MYIKITQKSDNLREVIVPEGKILVKYNKDKEIMQSIDNIAMVNDAIDLNKYELIDKPEEEEI